MSDKDDKSASIDVARRKEEAFRLKTLAEEKYNSGDLDSAVAYADRAHDLHPAVSGLRQMRTAFEILRAAAFSILDGSGDKQKPTPDYYTILQVQRFSHINSIKKQYKKLALTLHPDKNPFAASEEAFKLVGEAARVLSDKIRRKEYDMRLRIAMQSEAAEAVAVEVGEEGAGDTFWTTCSACRLLHQFQRKYLGHNLVCPKCKKTFKAVEVEQGKDDEGNGGVVGKNEGVEGGNTRASARIQERVAKGGYVGSVEKFGLGAKRRNNNLGEVSESSAAKVARNETEERVEKLGERDGVEKGRFKKMKKLVNVNGFWNVADGGVVEIVDNKTSKGAEVREEESMTLSQMQMMVKKKKKELVKENPSTKAKAAKAEKLKVNGLEEETNKDEGQIEKENVREEGSMSKMQNVREKESVEEMENVIEEQRAKEMAEKENEKVVNLRGSSNRRRVSKVSSLEEERTKEMEEEAEKEREVEVVKEKNANVSGSSNRRRVSKVRYFEEERAKEMEGEAEKEREEEAVKEKDANVRGNLNRRRVSKDRNWNLEEERVKEMEGEAEKEREDEAVKEKEANGEGNSNRSRVSKDRNLEEERVTEMEAEAEKEREEEAVKEKEANVRGNFNRRRVSKDRNLEEERSKDMVEEAEKEREEEAIKEKEENVRSLNRRRVSKVRNLEQERAKEMNGDAEKEREEKLVKEKEASVRGNSNQRRVSKDRNLEEERVKEREEEVEKEKEEGANVRGNSNRRRVSKDRNRVEERVKEREEEAEKEKEANLRGNLKRRRVQKVRNIKVLNATSTNHLYLENEMHISPENDNSEILIVEKEKEKETGVTKDKRERRRVSKYRNPNTLSRKSSNNLVDSDVERVIASIKGNLEITAVAVEDSDFHDFDKDRRERSFKKGQVWAVYDDVDAMPRHYALINDIISLNPFEVTLSWLDLQSNRDEELIDWLKKGFNVSCGIFQVSSEVTVRYLNLFSHIVYCERAARELYRIYPNKGSIWAVYSCSEQEAEERNEARRYGVVVTLSSYSDMHGLSIAYLEKVEGFRTVFKRREMGPKAVVCLGAKDMKIFSHQIPVKKLSGEEASGLPKNCWELDPASLTPQMLLTA